MARAIRITAGPPDRILGIALCREQGRDPKAAERMLGVSEFVLWFNVGGIDPGHGERAMRLAMERVIPHV